MDLRDRTGAITPAEGCMFLAMLLFAALLVTLVVMALLRLGDRPSSEDLPRPATSHHSPPAPPVPSLTAGGRVTGAGPAAHG